MRTRLKKNRSEFLLQKSAGKTKQNLPLLFVPIAGINKTKLLRADKKSQNSRYLAEWIGRLAVNAKVPKFLRHSGI